MKKLWFWNKFYVQNTPSSYIKYDDQLRHFIRVIFPDIIAVFPLSFLKVPQVKPPDPC